MIKKKFCRALVVLNPETSLNSSILRYSLSSNLRRRFQNNALEETLPKGDALPPT